MVKSYEKYLNDREEIFHGREDKFVCLMDLALMAMRKLKAEGKLQDQEESDEINACSIVVPVDVDGVEEEWLINFKNETHNHPTEIEPFGGAATCLGGAIRDPLSCDRRGRPDPSAERNSGRKTSAEETGTRGGSRIQFLRKPDWSGDGICKRNLSSKLCGKTYGDRSSSRSGAKKRRCP